MRIRLLLLMALIILLAVVGIGSQVKREDPAYSISESEVRESLNNFTFRMFSKMEFERKNTFISPFSIYSALAMTYEGARGDTAKEMASALHLPDGSPAEGYKSLSHSLSGIKTLKVANAIWVQRGFPIRQDYLSRVSKYYSGAVESLDFEKDPEGARESINSYIKEKTDGKIEELLQRGSIDVLTRLVITNAVHFKGNWRYKFDPADTFEGDFRTSNGVVKVQMMRMHPETSFNYTDIGSYEVLELPYEGRLSMFIFLPKEGSGLNLTLNDLKKAIESMREEEFDEILLPKFEVTSEYDINDLLIGLGMRKAFDQYEADFTGMYEREKVKENLYISLVRHKAYIKVDEEGTEAAGATGVVVKVTAVRERKVFAADHPFLFLIVDNEVGAILFMGSLVNPTAG